MSSKTSATAYQVFNSSYQMNKRVKFGFFEGLTNDHGKNSYEGLVSGILKMLSQTNTLNRVV